MTKQQFTNLPPMEAVRLKHHAEELHCAYNRILDDFGAAKRHTLSLRGMTQVDSNDRKLAESHLSMIRDLELVTASLKATIGRLNRLQEEQS